VTLGSGVETIVGGSRVERRSPEAGFGT